MRRVRHAKYPRSRYESGAEAMCDLHVGNAVHLHMCK